MWKYILELMKELKGIVLDSSFVGLGRDDFLWYYFIF